MTWLSSLLENEWRFREMCERKLAIQSCPTLCDPIDCSLAGSYVPGILKVRLLEWVPMSFSRGSSWPRDRTQGSCTTGRFFTVWAPREAREICRSAKWARGGLWQIQRCPVDQAGKCFLEFCSWYISTCGEPREAFLCEVWRVVVKQWSFCSLRWEEQGRHYVAHTF